MVRSLLVLPTGEEIFSGTVGENAITGVTVTRCVNGGEELTPGAVCADMLEMSVIASTPISLTAGDEVTLYTLDDSGQRQLEGIFIAEKPVWESANMFTLTAYDRVSKLDKDLTQWLEDLNSWPYKLLDFADMVCSVCGLKLIKSEIPNGEYLVQQFSGEGITGRQMMQWIGQAAGRFCRATPDGMIKFSWYESRQTIIGPEEKDVQTEPESVAVLDAVAEKTALRVVSEIKPSLSGWDGVTVKYCGKNLFNAQQMVTMKRATFDEETGLWTVDTKKLTGVTAAHISLITTGSGQKGVRDVSNLIRVPPNTAITIKVNDCSAVSVDGSELTPGNTYLGYGWHNADGTCHSAVNLYSATTKTVISPDIDPCYLDIRRIDATALVSFSSIQVELGSIATAYEPYRGKTVTQPFSKRIYGGSVDWQTGTITVTHEKIDSYNGQEVFDNWISDTGELSTGAQVVYMLEEPYQMGFDPQPIPALEGRNYLWSNTGDTGICFYQGYYFQKGLSFQDYQVTPIEKVQIRQTEEDVGAVYPDSAKESNTYIISGNYLLANENAAILETVAEVLYEKLKDITYTPCKIEIPASVGVQVGDVVTVLDQNGKGITVYVMNWIRSGQRIILECTGSQRRDSVMAVNEQSYKALSGKLLEFRTDIEGLRVAHRDAQGDFSNLEVKVEGISASVSQSQTNEENILQQVSIIEQTAQQVQISVQNLQTNGTSKVKTETGYTFDDEGLKISRSNAEMINLLDNTGMYVMRDNDVVLQANNEGVQAMNITVQNYLTVGKYTRFEDYNNGDDSKRTACFCTGG